uniref:CARD domain-containing protein n=1 Tax=Sinocyclocheilus anshuiensis TaxID=1608454 RepID=A0A671NV31_9TELE
MFSTRPGRYECVRTRMRWVCDCDITLKYQTVDGQFLNAELERLQCKRIAPVMDVTVISGKLEEVHLPHYICLGESEASLRDIHPQRDESRLKSEADKARYFNDHWPDLIQRVTNVQIIADKLLQQQLIHEEQYSEITQSLTSQDGMRKICEIIRKHDDTMKAKFISILREEKIIMSGLIQLIKGSNKG